MITPIRRPEAAPAEIDAATMSEAVILVLKAALRHFDARLQWGSSWSYYMAEPAAFIEEPPVSYRDMLDSQDPFCHVLLNEWRVDRLTMHRPPQADAYIQKERFIIVPAGVSVASAVGSLALIGPTGEGRSAAEQELDAAFQASTNAPESASLHDYATLLNSVHDLAVVLNK